MIFLYPLTAILLDEPTAAVPSLVEHRRETLA